MLQSIRENAQGTVAKIIVGLIVFTFAIFGVDSIIGGFGGEPEAAVVDGVDIKESELLRAVDLRKRQIIAQMGAQADPTLLDDVLLKKTTLESLINKQILLNNSESASFYMSDEALNMIITSFPDFRVDGKFSNDLLLAFLSNSGMTLSQFRATLLKDLIVNQYRSGVVGSAFTLNKEIDRLLVLDKETRDFDVMSLEFKDYVDSVNVSDEEVAEYYESNKVQFTKPDSVEIEYVALTKEGLAENIKISDAEILAKYDEFKKGFDAKEERKASHILVEVGDKLTKDQALSKVSDIRQKILDGMSFDEAAKTFSDDIGTAQLGGSLGYITPGSLDKEFEDALFAMKAAGDISSPVLTDYGYHLIQLGDVRVQEVPGLEQIKESLADGLRVSRAEKEFVEAQVKLADITYAANDLGEASQELKLPIAKLINVEKGAQDGDFSHPLLQKSLFSKEVLNEGRNTDAIEVSPEKVIVARVTKYEPEHLKALGDVRDLIVKEITTKKASELVLLKAQEILQMLEQGNSVENLVWKSYKSVQRNFAEEDAELVSAVFAKKFDSKGLGVGVKLLADGNVKVFRLVSINQTDLSGINDSQKSDVGTALSRGIGNVDYLAVTRLLREKALIELP